jgi:type IV secretory pathway TrbF-like protein
MKERTRSVDFRSFNKVSDHSWRVEWTEKTFGQEGYVEDTEQYVAIVELTHRRPTNKEEVERNPLGIYVTHFSMNRLSEGGNDGGSK